MTQNFDTVSVWGGHTADPGEIYDETYQEFSEDDLDRRSKGRTKDSMRKLRPGAMAIDGNKFSPAPNMVALYRVNGELAPIPRATYQHYLKKRDRNGNRIFYSRPPMEPPAATSDPCPCNGIDGKICGMRLIDQFELMRHIMKKHGDRAAFYLSQTQIDAAMGRISYNPGEGLSAVPTTAPTRTNQPSPDMVSVSLAENDQELELSEMEARRHKPDVDETLIAVDTVAEVVKPDRRRTKKNPSVPHTCEWKGRLNHYDDNCVRCLELVAEKLEGAVVDMV